MKLEADESMIGYHVANKQVCDFDIAPGNNQIECVASIVGRLWNILDVAERL